MIKIEKNQYEEFENFDFVLRAREKHKDNVFSFLLVTSIDECAAIVCTDSKRLHYAFTKNEEYESGLYEIIKHTKSEIVLDLIANQDDHQYPDIMNVIKDISKMTKSVINWNKRENGASALFILANNQLCLNPEHVKDASGYQTKVFFTAPDEPVYFNNGIGHAIIMPIYNPRRNVLSVEEIVI
jgi:hypothetical protein